VITFRFALSRVGLALAPATFFPGHPSRIKGSCYAAIPEDLPFFILGLLLDMASLRTAKGHIDFRENPNSQLADQVAMMITMLFIVHPDWRFPWNLKT
jgi:hypothetical protein